MSIYPPPSRYPSIFNPTDFSTFSTDTYLSTADANSTYAKLAGGQTIVGEETFTGGILTNTIGPSSGTTVSIGQNLLYAEGSIGSAFDITAVGDVQGATLIATTSSDLADATATSLTCGSASFSNNLIQGSLTTFASSFGTAATTHTITSTQLSWLGNNNWSGELKLFVDDVSGTTGTNAGISILYLAKPSSTLFVTQGNKATSLATFTTTFTNTTLIVTLSVSCRLCWIFTGAT